MKSRKILESSVDLLHPAMASGSLHLRSHPVSRGKTADNLVPVTPGGRPRRLAKKHKSPRRNELAFLMNRTWIIPLLLILAFLLLFALNTSESNIVHPFIFLSYKIENTTDSSAPLEYGKGPRDIAFVIFYTIVLFFTREFIMHELLRPLAISLGITSRSKQVRFNDQMYVAVFTSVIGPLGLYVMYQTPTWYFSTAGMYAGYPHKTHSGLTKFYYLLQAAFWVQQALVMILGLEERRRDFKELVVHHVVTVALIALSYRFHFTMMGVLVYVTHDISDFFLATSKTLNYLDSPLQGPYFTLCILIWVYLRHYINLRILFSILTEFRTIGPYILDWEAEQYKCEISNVITFALLAVLQALNLFWLYCLLRNAYRFVVLGVAKDDREEGEEDEKEREAVNNEVTGGEKYVSLRVRDH
ncbi:TLC domain-containing protein [Xylariaceae sp. FL1651]|nr:TLC domain-containing protein [Xylariaceae sp. FL1651]